MVFVPLFLVIFHLAFHLFLSSLFLFTIFYALIMCFYYFQGTATKTSETWKKTKVKKSSYKNQGATTTTCSSNAPKVSTFQPSSTWTRGLLWPPVTTAIVVAGGQSRFYVFPFLDQFSCFWLLGMI